MSGPEWTPESADAPVEGRPLNVGGGAAGPIPPPPAVQIGLNPFGVERSRATNPFGVERDDADAQANLDDDASAAGPGKLAALVGSVRSAVVGFWSRRRVARTHDEAEESAGLPLDLDPGATDPIAPDPLADPGDGDDLGPARSRSWSPARWPWETRVGVAAVFSFLVLVGVLVARKGWLGDGKPVTLALNSPADPAQPKPGKPADPATPTPVAPTVPSTPNPADSTSPPIPNMVPEPAIHLDHQPGTIGPRAAPDPSTPTSALTLATELPQTPIPATPPGPDTGEDPATTPNPTPTPEVDPVLGPGGDGDKPPAMPALPTNRPEFGPDPTLPDGPAPGAKPADAPPPASEPVGTPPTEPRPEPAPPSPTPASTESTTAPPPELILPPEVQSVEPPPTTPDVAQPAIQPVEPPPRKPVPDPMPDLPRPVKPAAPRPTSPPTSLESVPATSAEGEPTPSSKGPGWVVMPSAGKRPGAGTSGDPGSGASISGGDGASAAPGGRANVADGPPLRDDPGSGDGPAGVVLHTVQADENFWTISKQYYNSPRYYKALHKANSRQVPDISELYVGTVIRIPPPETLDRSLVSLPVPGATVDGPAVNRTSSAPRSSDPDSEMPPARTTRPGLPRARNNPLDPPRRPTYRVKANDTLRSIARDTLDNSKRAGEIFNLNRDTLTDLKATLAPGTTLTLPEDAVIGRRLR